MNPKIPKIGTPTILDAYNFLCKPPIEVRSENICNPHQELSKICCRPLESM